MAAVPAGMLTYDDPIDIGDACRSGIPRRSFMNVQKYRTVQIGRQPLLVFRLFDQSSGNGVRRGKRNCLASLTEDELHRAHWAVSSP